MKILKKEILAESGNTKTVKMVINSPLIAGKAKPGQFVVLMVKESGERVPLTVVDTDGNAGTVTMIFQELGFTTKLLGTMKEGDSLYSIVGPLGHATPIKKYGDVILVAGGVGIAEIYPVAKAMSAVGGSLPCRQAGASGGNSAGNKVTTIIGARTKDLLILEKELKSVSDNLHVVTDDGSYGRKGFVTDALKDILDRSMLVYAVGPIPMMRAVSNLTKESGIKTIVSLNALMVDGTGMCGSCRVTVGGEVKFSCVDGPEFDGHLVDWEELTSRNRIYEEKEKHVCKLNEAMIYGEKRRKS